MCSSDLGEAHFLTDPRYATYAKTNIDCKVHICKGPLYQDALQVVKRKRLKKIGFDPTQLTVSTHRALHDGLPGTSLVAVSGLVEKLRAVKSATEIAKIERSVQINSEAFVRTMRRAKSGMSESEVAAELDYQMRKLGAEKPAFDTIVAAGPNSALPHAHPSSHRILENELLLIDMGAFVEGYASDMTRMVHFGPPPARTKQLYNAVLEAQLAALDTVRAGVAVTKVDAAARNVLKKYGFDKAFVHSTGHGLGLEIHELPKIGRPAKTATKQPEVKLETGMAITIEPGAYLEGFNGVRIEDTVVVTETGCRVLTPTTKELLTLY